MNSAVEQSVFSLPLSHLSDPIFSCDHVLTENTVRGLSRYIGDERNQLVRFFCRMDLFDSFAWPIFLCGPTGTGKTSIALTLVSDIVRSLALQFSDTKQAPTVLSAPDLARRYNAAIETDSVAQFRDRLTQSSVVMVDNIHLLERKPHVQNELVFLIDLLAERSVPAIFTSLTSHQSLTKFSAQLKSRLLNGLSINLNLPGSLARREILSALFQIHELNIGDETLDWLSDKLSVSVPQINQLVSQVKLSHQTANPAQLDIRFFEELFADNLVKSISEKSSIIIEKVAREFHLKPADLKTNSRKQSNVAARGVAIFLCRKLLDVSFKKIGQWFGKRDHSTIMHAFNKMHDLMESDQVTPVKSAIWKLQIELEEEFNTLTQLV